MQHWNYWDGEIIKAPDGKYHLFASRWAQARGHGGWFGSQAVHAVSDNLIGPYVDKGLCWPTNAGGQRSQRRRTHLARRQLRPRMSVKPVPAKSIPQNRSTVRGKHLGTVTVEGEPRWHASNVKIMVRPDGKFEFIGTRRPGFHQ